MIKITKLAPPDELMQLKEEAERKGLDPKAAYNMLAQPLKSKVLEQLIREQGHLCAYCMRQIPDDRDKPKTISPATIEHWYPVSPDDGTDIGQGLDYNNMLAVCSGNRNARGTRKRRDFTCDARRENKALSVNPLDDKTIDLILYKENGEIYSEDEKINDDLQVKLNLNCLFDAVNLPKARKAALEVIQEDLKDLDSEEEILEQCRELLDFYQTEPDPKTPYCGIIIWWLKSCINE